MMSQQTPRSGRCQHCKQIRPLFEHKGELQFWGYEPDDAAWLCARDWSAREAAVENDQAFYIDRAVKPFQAAADKAVCEGIAEATHHM